MSSVRGGGDGVSHLLDDFLGVRSWWFIQEGGTGLRKLAFFRQGRGPVTSSLKVTRIVESVCAVVVGFKLPFRFCQRDPSWRLPATVRTLVACHWTPFSVEGPVPEGTGG